MRFRFEPMTLNERIEDTKERIKLISLDLVPRIERARELLLKLEKRLFELAGEEF